jgi:hypothetical protein
MDEREQDKAGGRPEDVGKPDDTPGFGPPTIAEPQDGGSGSEPAPPIGGPNP